MTPRAHGSCSLRALEPCCCCCPRIVNISVSMYCPACWSSWDPHPPPTPPLRPKTKTIYFIRAASPMMHEVILSQICEAAGRGPRANSLRSCKQRGGSLLPRPVTRAWIWTFSPRRNHQSSETGCCYQGSAVYQRASYWDPGPASHHRRQQVSY